MLPGRNLIPVGTLYLDTLARDLIYLKNAGTIPEGCRDHIYLKALDIP
jgi:hypothetical protein